MKALFMSNLINMLTEGRRSTMSGGHASSERSLTAIKSAERGKTIFVTGCGFATLKPEEPVDVYLAVCLGNNRYKVRSAYAERRRPEDQKAWGTGMECQIVRRGIPSCVLQSTQLARFRDDRLAVHSRLSCRILVRS